MTILPPSTETPAPHRAAGSRRSLVQRLATAASVVAMATVGVLGGAPAAMADDHPITITKYTVADQVIDRPGCKAVYPTVTTAKKPNYARANIEHSILDAGGNTIAMLFSDDRTEIRPLGLDCAGTLGYGENIISDYALGKYTIGPAEIHAWFTDQYGGREYTSKTAANFYVRGKSTVSLTASRKNSTITFTATATTYDKAASDEDDRAIYKAYNPKGAKLQVKSGSTWKDVKTLTFSKGKATTTVSSSASSSTQYRVTYPQTSIATGASAAVTVAAPPASGPFLDVKPGVEHYEHMKWMSSSKISTGWKVSGGYEYRPLAPVNRDAMAAFLYRMAGSPKVTLPKTSPFTDVKPGQEHYTAIMWAYQKGITTGWTVNGKREFRPTTPINRDAMAAFLYRFAGEPKTGAASSSCFKDVSRTQQFAKEMCWMKSQGISTGWSDGTYRPLQSVKRDAMAAFLHRYDAKY